MVNLKMKLSENFSLEEFVTSQVASRSGIDNTPSVEVVDCLRVLCETILEPATIACGPLKISSGYRSPQLNRAVGGSETSGHKLGYCADVIPLDISKVEFAKWVKDNCKFDQIILEFGAVDNPDWIHVSSDPRHRGDVLRILNGTGYVPAKI
jgi:hypothetical protein